MASKVLVGVSQAGFFQQGKRREEVVNLGYVGSNTSNPEVRVKQLEQNIRFLQEQHQIMLSGLHREVEVLRRRNRGGVAVVDATPTMSPDEENLPRSIAISPGQVNITPLQVELLERDLAELKTNLSEARTRNLYLQSVVDDQKKVIQTMEDESNEMAAVGKKIEPESKRTEPAAAADEEDVEAMRDKLDDSDRMVRRLRRENEEQRKEIVSLRSAVGRVMSERRTDGGYRQSYPRNSPNQFSQTSRFPPLYPPNNHWNYSKHNGDYQRDRGGPRTMRENEAAQPNNTSLPLLKERNSGPSTSGYNSGGYGTHRQDQGGPGQHRRGYGQRGNRSYRNQNRDPQTRGPD